MRPEKRSVRACLFAAIASFSVAGCSGIDPLDEVQRENAVLRFENERRRESLVETFEEIARQKRSLTEVSRDKATLTNEIVELANKVRSTTDQLVSVTAQRDELKVKLVDLQGSNERLRDNVDKVREVASSSAGELAELRTRGKDLEERNQALVKTEAALREETARLSQQVKELEAAVAQAKAPSPNGADHYQQGLERELAGLRGENFALQKRLEAMEVASGSRPTAAPVTGAEPSAHNAVYREDPSGLFKELGGLLVLRYERALQGSIAWDEFDLAAVAVASLVLLLLVSLLCRLCLGRRARSSAERSDKAVEIQETGEAESDNSAEEAVENQPSASVPQRRAGVRRRSGYPAIYSAKNARASEDELADEEGIAAEVTQSLDVALDDSIAERPRAQAPTRKAATKTARAEPVAAATKEVEARKVIGARSWEPEDGAAGLGDSSGEEDNMASTQVIPTLSILGDDDPVAVAAASAKPVSAKSTSPARGPGRAPAAPPAQSEDRELLQELKSVINRKFDELMK